jgi:hypothetical protein
MPVPWLQIVQLVPSLVEVSRELLKKTSRPQPGAGGGPQSPGTREEVLARIAALEENERRQAELVTQMAEQLAALSRAATLLHRRVLQLAVGCAVAMLAAVIALIVALR